MWLNSFETESNFSTSCSSETTVSSFVISTRSFVLPYILFFSSMIWYMPFDSSIFLAIFCRASRMSSTLSKVLFPLRRSFALNRIEGFDCRIFCIYSRTFSFWLFKSSSNWFLENVLFLSFLSTWIVVISSSINFSIVLKIDSLLSALLILTPLLYPYPFS